MKAHARLVLLVVGMVLVAAGSARADWGPVERIAAVDGRIIDVSADRILYTTDFTYAIEDRATGNVTMINHVLNKGSRYGFLTSRGAILQFRHGSGSPDDRVYEWRDGQRIDLNQGPTGTQNYSLTAAGDYAIWYAGGALYRRDIASGTTTLVDPAATNSFNDVAANGDVVFWTTPAAAEIFRWRNGVTEQLTSDGSASLKNIYPLTDGNLVVYRKTAGCCIDDPGRVAIYENGQEVVLDSLRTPGPTPYMDYRVENGWVAYTRPGQAGELQVWVRDPAGQVSQVSPNGLDAQIVGLGPQGDVLFRHRSGTPRDVYLGQPGVPLVNLGSSLGGAFPSNGISYKRIDGEWYEGLGRLLSKLRRSSYVRPLAASPLKVPLVPAYDRCESPNRQHGPPLDSPSCSPPSQSSDHLTMGTADANPNAANFVGNVRMQVLLGDPGTPADEADVKLDLTATDVRTAGGALEDYAGELRPTVPMTTTDRDTTATLNSGSFRDMEDTTPVRIRTTFPSQHGLSSGDQILLDPFPRCIGEQPWTVTVIDEDTLTLDGSTACGEVFNFSGRWYERGEPGTGPGTGVEVPLSFTAGCAPTPDPAIGSTCSVSTTAEAVVPGMVKEGMRSNWQLGKVQVFDGGADGDAETEADNTLFATQGVFIP